MPRPRCCSQSLARGHPLIDGNQRPAWVAMVVFLGLNGVALDAPEDAAYDLVIAVSNGVLDHQASSARLSSWSLS